jgi:hypothetical protein
MVHFSSDPWTVTDLCQQRRPMSSSTSSYTLPKTRTAQMRLPARQLRLVLCLASTSEHRVAQAWYESSAPRPTSFPADVAEGTAGPIHPRSTNSTEDFDAGGEGARTDIAKLHRTWKTCASCTSRGRHHRER